MRSQKEQVDKLPRWAQNLIGALSSDVAHWKKMAYAVGTDGDSPISLLYGLNEQRVPPGSTVRFRLSEGWIDIRLSVDGDRLLVYGDTSVRLLPESSNHFKIERGR